MESVLFMFSMFELTTFNFKTMKEEFKKISSAPFFKHFWPDLRVIKIHIVFMVHRLKLSENPFSHSSQHREKHSSSLEIGIAKWCISRNFYSQINDINSGNLRKHIFAHCLCNALFFWSKCNVKIIAFSICCNNINFPFPFVISIYSK